MSIPTSLLGGPFNSLILVKKRYLIAYIFLIWISIMPCVFEFWFYWQIFWDNERPIFFFIYLPFLVLIMYFTIVFTSLLFAKVLMVIINAVHKPREGVFLRHPSDKDYRYWSLRNVIKRWPFWLSHRFPFPFLDNICFKAFGVKTKFSNSLFEGWVDTEFVEFGKNIAVGQAAIIQSTLIVGNLLIIKKTIIDDNVRIGAHCIIMPGTHIGKNCILNTWSATMVGQELEEGWIYIGGPAQKFKKNRFFEDGIIDEIADSIENLDELTKRYDSQYVKSKRKAEYVSSQDEKSINKEKKEKKKN